MANSLVMALFCPLLAFVFISSISASSEIPFIVVHKKAELIRPKAGGERVSVSIDVYNQGSVSAYDVGLIDDSWSKDIFDVANGNISKSWERLDAGASVSHSFELECKGKATYHGAPAIITFRIPTKTTLQEAFSTPIFPLDILADRPPEKKLDWAKRVVGKYGSQISVLSIVVLFVYLVATPSRSNPSKGSKKKR